MIMNRTFHSVALVCAFVVLVDAAGPIGRPPPPPLHPIAIDLPGKIQTKPDRPPPPLRVDHHENNESTGNNGKKSKHIPPPPRRDAPREIGNAISRKSQFVASPNDNLNSNRSEQQQQRRRIEERIVNTQLHVSAEEVHDPQEGKVNREVKQQPPPPVSVRPPLAQLYHTQQLRHQPPPQQNQQLLHPQQMYMQQGPIPIRPIISDGPGIRPRQSAIQRSPHRPQQQRPQPTSSPLWKSLWQRVERGLDVLADMEDVVTDRASHWLSKPAALIPTQRASVPQPKPLPVITEPKPVVSSRTTAAPQRTFGSKFEVAKQAKARKTTVQSSRNINWEQLQAGRSMIKTNGGASQPNSEPPSHLPRVENESASSPPRRRENIFTASAAAAWQKPTAVPLPLALEAEEESMWSKIVSRIPSLPTMPLSKFLGKGSGSFRRLSRETMEAWEEEDNVAHRVKKSVRNRQQETSEKFGGYDKSASSVTPPIADMLARSDTGKSPSLLLSRDIAQCNSIGWSKAILDIVCLGFILLGSHALLPALQTVPLSSSFVNTFLPALGTALLISSETWAYYAFVAAILTAFTNYVLFEGTVHSLSAEVGQLVRSGTQYCQLYMRLVASTPVEKLTQERVKAAAVSQVIGAVQFARLKSFVDLLVASLIIMTVSILQPIALTLYGGLAKIIALRDWRVWPPLWSSLLEHVKEILLPLVKTLTELVVGEAQHVLDYPMNAAFQATTFAALLLVTLLPNIEQRRKVAIALDDDEEDEDSSPSLFGTVKTLSNLGVSSASRLGLLSKSGALEGTLERWRASIPKPVPMTSYYSSISTFLRLFSYTVISGVILVSPIMVFLFAGAPCPSKMSWSNAILRWDSVFDVSILLLFTFGLAWRALSAAVDSSTLKPYVSRFVHNLAETVEEATSTNRSGMSRLGTSMSPVKGLSVTDLWTAHSTKRAWSVRGANLECPAGNVLVILGEDGSGKTRLLTAIAEAMVFPAKRSLSNTKVRGSVSVGGLDATKWDRSELKKRLGLFLNDVRTISDNAEFMSGFTLEEILEPMDGLLSRQSPGTRERSAMNMALEITGLSTSLLPRLPSKLSTVVSANEDELAPSPTRPRCNPLSPAEWSKLLLARVLAQTIYDNDYSKSGSAENSLVGSLLLLDDVTAYMSEVEETRTLTALRRTGAATVLTSHKWATGRFADRIVVMKDGAVVESGTHAELLSRGPQQSLYAQKWYAMTSSY